MNFKKGVSKHIGIYSTSTGAGTAIRMRSMIYTVVGDEGNTTLLFYGIAVLCWFGVAVGDKLRQNPGWGQFQRF